MDHFSYPDLPMYSFLYWFAIFAYYLIHRFITVTTSSTLSILLRIIIFYFHIIIIMTIIPCDFFTPASADGLSLEFEWQLVSMTLLSSLVDVKNVVVWLISARLPISNFSSPFTKPLRIVPSASITIVITIIFTLHSFFGSLTRSKY